MRNLTTKLTFLITLLLLSASVPLRAQVCPPNIDFEKGNFSNWKAYTGNVSAATGSHVFSLFESGAAPGQHEMFNRANHSFLRDEYGGFPVICPNGSGYSVKLGNTQGGAGAEGLSYEFTIPAGRNEYSITYYYAVVFEGPNHLEFQQPRLEIEVLNVTDNQRIDCSSFTFFSYGSSLPGFQTSALQLNNNTPVLYKDWTPVTINLNNKAGKTIRIFFKTGDCTFVRHFGYAYVDVNTECNGEFPGASFCPNDALVSVDAPFGFQNYRWFNSNFSTLLGTGSNLTLRPAPASGTLLAVEVTPFDGYGCKDTIYTRLLDTLTVQANAGADGSYCGIDPVIIGVPPKPGRVYSWSPATGLSDAGSSSPLATPLVTTTYVLTVSSNGGGCRDTDTVVVESLLPDTTLRVAGKLSYCITSRDSAVLFTTNGVQTQWYKDGAIMPGATSNRLRAASTGNYYAVVTSPSGCTLSTRTVSVYIETPVPGMQYPLRYTFPEREIALAARDIGEYVIWSPPTLLNSDTVFTPLFRGNDLGTFTYNIRITSEAGCVAVDTQMVKIISKVEVFMPNAFTPNNDGLNDLLRPLTTGIEEVYAFRIFNRYGQIVYTWSPQSKGWDGRFKSILQDPGTYIWQFNGRGIDGVNYTQKGFVILMR
jgi:gliding motility-associated-like protein